jgi:mannose-6-phosphate isomerase-like protein (cupin superfamily)
MTSSIRPFAVQRGEGAALRTPVGDTVRVKTSTRDTGGAMTVLEFAIAPGSGPALHTHVREDEVWYVLEGEFRFKAGEAMFRVPAGGMAFGPRRTPHTFQNVGAAPGRLLVITAPSGAERFFEDFNGLPAGVVAAETVAALGHAHGIEFVGPPLAVSDPLER